MQRRFFAVILVWTLRLFALLPLLSGVSSLLKLADATRLGDTAPTTLAQQIAAGIAGTAAIAYFTAAFLLLGLAELLRIAVDIEVQQDEKTTEDRVLARSRELGSPDASYLLQDN